MTYKELLPLIRSKGKDDRYSENLCKWVKKHGSRGLYVAFSGVSWINGEEVTRDTSKCQANQIIIGRGDMSDGWVHGSKLNRILAVGGQAEVFAFNVKVWGVVPLLGWFEDYIKGGKCFIDPEHHWYGPERWQVNGKTRTCSWCGQWHEIQRKRRVSKTVTTWELLR